MLSQNVQHSSEETTCQPVNTDTFFTSLEEKEEETTKTEENQEEEREIKKEKDEKALLSCLFAFTYLMESTLTSQNEEDIIQSEPINHFYFCSSNKLTIGYGTKIECDNDGKLAKEGREVLKKLKIYKNNRELTETEKQKLVRDCCAKRNQYDRVNGENKFCKLSAHNQAKVLFGDNPAPVTKESALSAALTEYQEKQQKLLKNNKNFNMNLIVKAIGTDLAYQYGSCGVKTKKGSSYFYDCVQKGYLPGNGKFDSQYGDRTLLRNWMLQTARSFEDDKKKRKGQQATSQSQSKLFLTALKSFEKTFHQHIMNRQPSVKLLMEQSLSLVLVQNFLNIYGRYPQSKEIKKIHKTSQDFVYKELYGSSELDRVKKNGRECAITKIIKAADINAPDPITAIRAAAKKEVDKIVAENEKKEKGNGKGNRKKTEKKTGKKTGNGNKKTNQQPKLTAFLKSAEEKTEEINSNLFIHQRNNTQGRA